MWQFDTAREFDTVNGVAGDRRHHQRRPDRWSPAGWCSSPSGYSELGNGVRGNVLLAFAVPGESRPAQREGYNQDRHEAALRVPAATTRAWWRWRLVLATINQVFSLLDPLIFRHVIDEYATRFQEYRPASSSGASACCSAAAVGVAFVSRVAKNFQDYYINVITQRLGAQLYSDGIRHSLELPYSVFEDQRSGETLGRLQKVRTDVEKLIATSINVLFTSLVGIIFVMVYAFSVHWLIAPVYFLTVPILGVLSSVLSRRIKQIQKVIVAETTALAGSTTESLRNIELVKSLGLGQQEIARLNGTTGEDPEARAEEGEATCAASASSRAPSVNLLRTSIMFLMLYLIYTRAITVGQFFSLFIYSFFIFGPLQELGQHHQRLPRDRSVAERLRGRSCSMPRSRGRRTRVPLRRSRRTLAFEGVTFQHQSASVAGGQRHLVRRPARRDDRVRRAVRRRQDDAGASCWSGCISRRPGRILYNGIPGGEIDLDALRAQIGFVTQDTQLFSGTIRENLLFVNPIATDAECLEVLRKAACDSLLARAPIAASTRSSARAASRCRAAKSSGCRSRGRCCGVRICWSSTRRPRRSTRSPKKASSTPSATSRPAATRSPC